MKADEKLLDQLSRFRGSKTLLVGIGNTLKGDDGLGSLLCQQLSGNISAEIIDTATVPENYIQPIIKKNPDNLLIIDAIDFGASAGTIRIFEPQQLNALIISTHTLSPRIFVDMITQEIDVNVYFVGVQPAQTNFGQSLSADVEQAMQSLADILIETFPLRRRE